MNARERALIDRLDAARGLAEAEYAELAKACENLTAHDKVFLARHRKRPKIDDYINALFEDFFTGARPSAKKISKDIFLLAFAPTAGRPGCGRFVSYIP